MRKVAFVLTLGILLELGWSCRLAESDWNGRLYARETEFGLASETWAIWNGVEVGMPSVTVRRISVPTPVSVGERLHPTLDKWLWQQCKQDFTVLHIVRPYKVPSVHRPAWFTVTRREVALQEFRHDRRISVIESSDAALFWNAWGYLLTQDETSLNFNCICLPGEYVRKTGKPCIGRMEFEEDLR